MNLSELWSRLLAGEPTACAFAGEDLIVGDASGLLLRLDTDGNVLSERPLPAPIRDICTSPDGRLTAVVCGDGEVALLQEDTFLFQRSPGCFAGMVRLGPDAGYLIVMSRRGEGIFLNRYGREMGRLTVPDGARSLTLVPETGHVLTLNHLGEVRAWSTWGKPLWEAPVGPDAKAVRSNDSGDLVLVPNLSFGVAALTASGGSIGAYDVGEAVAEATCDSKGSTLLFSTLRNRLIVMRRDATVMASLTLPTSITRSVISPDGTRMLVATGSGYVHLFAMVENDALESEASGGASHGRRLFQTRIFSAFSMMMPPRAGFARGNELVLIAGGGGRATIIDLQGEIIDVRPFRGRILDLDVTDSGTARMVTTEAVAGFDVGSRDSTWEIEAHLVHTTRRDDGTVLALGECGTLYSVDREGRELEQLFSLHEDRVAGLASVGLAIAVAMKDGELVVFDRDGNVLGRGGPWPTCPHILAAGPGNVLCGAGRTLALFGSDGSERWRRRQEVACRDGVRLPGSYLVRDDSGAAYSITDAGTVRRAFNLGQAKVMPFPDYGDGPGFLLLDGRMLSAIDTDGRPRWKFRLQDPITYAAASPDGRLAAVVSGLDLSVFEIRV